MGNLKYNTNSIGDKDGLVFSRYLQHAPYPPNKSAYAFQIRSKFFDEFCYPPPEIRGVLDLLINDPKLWNLSRIRILPKEVGQKRMMIFGVSFEKAVRIALLKGSIRSRFMLNNPDHFADIGLVADLMVHVSRDSYETGATRIQVEAWERLGNGPEVFYIHALFTEKLDFFMHLDGALIDFSPEEFKLLLSEPGKVKGPNYQKQFRLDSNNYEISSVDGFKIIRSYLPVSELTDEFFDVSDAVFTA